MSCESVSPPRPPELQQGFSLIELMVALSIGLVVIGAVFTNYLHNSVAARQTAAMAQVTGDASLALGILRNHLALAGFSQPSGVSTDGLMTPRLTGPAILGCSNNGALAVTQPRPSSTGGNGTSSSGTTASNTSSASWSCPSSSSSSTSSSTTNTTTSSATSDSMLVRYETDTDMSPATTDTPARPKDCIGDGILAESGTPAGQVQFIAESRFYISTSNTIPSLYCMGKDPSPTTSATGQPLVENVSEMHLWFGIATTDPNSKKLQQIQRYVTATDVGALPGQIANWSQVKAIRICLVVRSDDEVLPSTTAYRNCANASITPSDRRIYRAFTSTVVLNNRASTL